MEIAEAGSFFNQHNSQNPRLILDEAVRWPKARYIEYESQLKKNPHSSTRRLKFSQLFYFSNDP